jgi:hypothetical protein
LKNRPLLSESPKWQKGGWVQLVDARRSISIAERRSESSRAKLNYGGGAPRGDTFDQTSVVLIWHRGRHTLESELIRTTSHQLVFLSLDVNFFGKPINLNYAS